MATNVILTDQGISNSIIAQQEKGFDILVKGFGVSETAGELESDRTTTNPEWYTGALGAGIRINNNTVELRFSIPAGADTVDRYVKEIYIYADDNLGGQYLLAIAQPDPDRLYTPSGALIFRIQMTIQNINVGDIYQFIYTQAQDISEHDENPNAHPLLRERMGQVGSFAQEVDRVWIGQTIDQFALSLIIDSGVSDMDAVYFDTTSSTYKQAVNGTTPAQYVTGIYIEANDMVIKGGIIDYTHSLDAYTNIYLSSSVAGELTTAYSTKLIGHTLPDNKLFIDIKDLVKFGSILGGGSAGSFIPIIGNIAPVEEFVSGMDLLGFSDNNQEMYFNFKVPEGYVAGNLLALMGGVFYCSNTTTGKVLMKAATTLLKKGNSNLTESTNVHISTNIEANVAAITNDMALIGNIDLTDSTGKINSVDVEAGDILKIRLYRDTDNESASVDDTVLIPRTCFEPKKQLN